MGEVIWKGDDEGWHALLPDQPVETFRQVLAEADPIRVGKAAAGEADKVHKQGQSVPVMPGRNVDIDHAHLRIAQHIALEGFALDGNATNGTRRPEELAHVSYPWLQLMLSRASLPAAHQPFRLSEVRR